MNAEVSRGRARRLTDRARLTVCEGQKPTRDRLQRALGNAGYREQIQMKLEIGHPSDPLEAEADRIAERVVRMPEPPADTTASGMTPGPVQRKCAGCQAEDERLQASALGAAAETVHRQVEEEEEEEMLQSKPLAGAAPIPGPAPPGARGADGRAAYLSGGLQASVRAVRREGTALPASVRAFFEPRMGFDFSGVRLNTGARAARTASALNARAFTVGGDVAFRAGHYDPASLAGRRLLAHELAHVMQQGRAQRLPAPSCDGEHAD